MESTPYTLFFVSKVNPTIIEGKVSNKIKSYLNKGPKVANPMKNFEEFTSIILGYNVSPANITIAAIPIITK